MIDLETLDIKPTAAIISIGAVAFDRNGLGNSFYSIVDGNTSTAAGMTISQDTINWWKNQSEEAQSIFHSPDKTTIQNALTAFGQWLPHNCKLWGNGAAFDNAVLSNAYSVCGMGQPWRFWNDRCYRTLSSFTKNKRVQSGTHHNALDDAKSQAQHMIDYMNSYIQ